MPDTRRTLIPVIAGTAALAVAAAMLFNRYAEPEEKPAAEAAGRGAEPAAAGPDTPIVLYLVDTLRADWLGTYGYAKATSPRIDALAAESVVFERAYAAGPWTLPSVASLVTSRYPCEHGVFEREMRLNPAVTTMAERLQSLGFATGAYYQNVFAGSIAGLDRGYQTSVVHENVEAGMAKEAREFILRAGDHPFLLYLHSMEPHSTFWVPPRFIQHFGHVSAEDREIFRALTDVYRLGMHADFNAKRPFGTSDTEPDIRKSTASMARMRDKITLLYDAGVLHADHNLGQVVDVLKETGLWDRAVFIFMADHGEEFAEHGGWFHDQSVYEELLHVPLVVHFPGGAHGGRRIGERVSLLDVMPTVLDYLGRSDLCVECRGSSLLPLLNNAGPGSYQSTPVIGLRVNKNSYYRPVKMKRGDVNVAIRDGQWKGIWNAEPGRLELYDLGMDPREQNDLSDREPERAGRLAQEASAWLAACNARLIEPEFVPIERVDVNLRDMLRAHGYFK
jgi:arylsulfatase A-like enzyme